jgi:phage tail sheath protein FI
MPDIPTYPGVFIEEVPGGGRTLTGVPTSITAFVGRTRQGPTHEPIAIHGFTDFERLFGGLHVEDPMSYAVRDYYLNGGNQAIIIRTESTELIGDLNDKTGLFALEKADLFNLLCIPPYTRNGDTPAEVYRAALTYCVKRRAMLIVDPPGAWSANKETAATQARDGLAQLGLTGTAARNAALYFPRVQMSDPLREGLLDTFVPCGAIAGMIARTDSQRGVWKSPAGMHAVLNGVIAPEVNLTDRENGMLNPLGINCLRSFPGTGCVVWGSRTLSSADRLSDEYQYIPVRRLALYIEESLYRGLQWVVFEPNNEPLRARIRLSIENFMQDLFRLGAFLGHTPQEAYFVKCDQETTTQHDIDQAIVNVLIGFAPLKPAEFVIIKIQLTAGQTQI